jgi:phosphoribosylformimino-5-aminoimidazole carboxamide ribonucleotide (ProFAR) isomerase
MMDEKDQAAAYLKLQDDVKQLIASNTAGAIIGRSLYEGQMDLVEVLRLSNA